MNELVEAFERLRKERDSYKRVLMEVAEHIDWDQQDASRFYIGEDAAEMVLLALDFDHNEGQCNEAVAKHVTSLRTRRVDK